MRYYTEEHEWIDDEGRIGISNHAQDQLGDIVFVELPDIGRKVKKGEETAVVESAKAASDIYAPVDGAILSVNEALEETPDLINSDAEGDGWLFQLDIEEGALSGLMDEAAYKAFLDE